MEKLLRAVRAHVLPCSIRCTRSRQWRRVSGTAAQAEIPGTFITAAIGRNSLIQGERRMKLLVSVTTNVLIRGIAENLSENSNKEPA